MAWIRVLGLWIMGCRSLIASSMRCHEIILSRFWISTI
jgi:hypothetical protein